GGGIEHDCILARRAAAGAAQGSQTLPGAINAHFHRLGVQPQQLAGLLVREALQRGEQQGFLERAGQGGNAALQLRHLLVGGHGGLGIGPGIGQHLGLPLLAGQARKDVAHGVAACPVAALVQCYAPQPRLKGTLGLISRQRQPGREERLLQHVVGIVCIAYVAAHKAVDPLLVPPHEQGKSIVFARERTPHERCVGLPPRFGQRVSVISAATTFSSKIACCGGVSTARRLSTYSTVWRCSSPTTDFRSLIDFSTAGPKPISSANALLSSTLAEAMWARSTVRVCA